MRRSTTARASAQSGRLRTQPWEEMRNRIVWRAWAFDCGGEDQLQARYGSRARTDSSNISLRTDEISAYRAGKKAFSVKRMDAIVAAHPNVKRVTEWPLYLLAPTLPRRRDITAWVEKWTADLPSLDGVKSSGFKRLEIIDDPQTTAWRKPVDGDWEIFVYEPRQTLLRNDMDGFLIILSLFRNALASRDADAVWKHVCDLIRAIPGACRDPRVRPDSECMLDCTLSLLKLLPIGVRAIDIDMRTLRQQIDSPPTTMRRKVTMQGRKESISPADPIRRREHRQVWERMCYLMKTVFELQRTAF